MQITYQNMQAHRRSSKPRCRNTVEQYIDVLTRFHKHFAPGLLVGGFMAAGREIFSIKNIRVSPTLYGKRASAPIALCASCGEAYPKNGNALCLACQGMALYVNGLEQSEKNITCKS